MREPVRVVAARQVVTMADSDVTAFAVRGARIVAVGDAPTLLAAFPGAEVTDLGDATVIPAFNDAHMHPSMAAEDLLHLDASAERVASRAELIALLAAEAARTPPGRWIRATRYDHTRTTGGQLIDRSDLDAVSDRHPILVVHVGAHWGVANSAGLAAGGHDVSGASPADDLLGRDGAGRLTGLLNEQALFDYCYPSLAAGGRPVIPAADLADRLRALARFSAQSHAAGIASATDALTGPDELRLFGEARRAGQLTLRVNALLAYPHLERLDSLGLSSGFGDEWLRIGGVKAFADGAVAGRTCLVEQPFEGSSDHGVQTMSDQDMRDLALRCQASGNRLAIHANGDRAIAKVLAAIGAAQARAPRPGMRHRIEHCSIVTPEIVAEMRRLGVIAVPFGGYVDYHGEKLLAWYGAERLRRMFAHRWMLDAGIPVAGSSDYPCGPLEPLRALRGCVTRAFGEGQSLGPEQRVTAREALALYTTGSAFASGEQAVKGRIAPGLLADFTVLDEDVLRVAPERIASVAIRSTWVGGEQVWAAD